MENQKRGEEFFKALILKSWRDSNFKEQLTISPKESIKEFSEGTISIPENISVVVEDQTSDSFVFLNIPKRIDLENLELNEEQLELVAGGWERTGNGLWYDIGWNFGKWLCDNGVK